jgi:hypothetical protein
MDEEIITGYCSLCRQYERNNYSEVLSKMNHKHYTACKGANCLHPVFYIADHRNKTLVGFTVELIQNNLTEDPNLSLDFD